MTLKTAHDSKLHKAPKTIQGLSDIADQYDVILCDAWGVIHNGVALYAGVNDAMCNFQQQDKPLFILTNAPRLSNVIPAQLDHLGLSRDAYSGVVTSGDATLNAIQAFKNRPAFRIGPDKDNTVFDAMNVDFVPMANAAFIFCTGLFDDETETPDDYEEMLQEALTHKLPMVCANPDIIVRRGDRTIYCGGAIAQKYADMGGEVILSGKPHSPIYDLARIRIAEKCGDNAAKTARILCIGDGFGTDILGANRQDIDVLYVAEGIYKDEARDANGNLNGDKLHTVLKDHHVFAEYAIEALVW